MIICNRTADVNENAPRFAIFPNLFREYASPAGKDAPDEAPPVRRGAPPCPESARPCHPSVPRGTRVFPRALLYSLYKDSAHKLQYIVESGEGKAHFGKLAEFPLNFA